MNVIVICTNPVFDYPPLLSLVAALLDLGHKVTLLANSVDSLPSHISDSTYLETIELGDRSTSTARFRAMFAAPKKIHEYLKLYSAQIDLVWVCGDIAARDTGKILYNFPYVLQLYELADYVPLFARRSMPLHYHEIKSMALRAQVVTVPEYNRAHIQKVFWNLPHVPTVLPNKPYPDILISKAPYQNDHFLWAKKQFAQEKRKILLYQGIYNEDRDMLPYAKALEFLNDEYVLYLMGRIKTLSAQSILDKWTAYPNIVDLGYIKAPAHLQFTEQGYIGLLPYQPTSTSRMSPLNALYCAPNKIWEYSRIGLPMLGSDVPGLTLPFGQYKMGITTSKDPKEIAQAIRTIEEHYDEYHSNSLAYYHTCDYKQLVANIVQKATSGSSITSHITNSVSIS